jgi:hypothetical protein
MTIAIRRDNGDILWFDAIEGFDEALSSTVTKHPVATGGFVADHITKDNPRFTLRGILSDADFNYNRPLLDYNTATPGSELNQGVVEFPVVTRKQFVNNTPTNSPVTINSGSNVFKSFLPESIAQFTQTSIPEVIVTEQPKVKTASAVRLDLVHMREMKETFTLVDFEDNLVRRSWTNCVLTNLSFSETPDGGDARALFPVMEIEQVVFSTVENIRVRLKPINKGRQPGTSSKRPEETGDNAKTGPTKLNEKTSSQLVEVNTSLSTP